MTSLNGGHGRESGRSTETSVERQSSDSKQSFGSTALDTQFRLDDDRPWQIGRAVDSLGKVKRVHQATASSCIVVRMAPWRCLET
jgi:hypothetical protein